MESIENYNVMIIHGAYGKEKGFLDEKDTNEAYYAEGSLENGATLGLTIIVTVLRTGCRLRSLKNRDGRIKKNM